MWESLETLIEAAEQGDANAQFNLGAFYLEGIVVKQDYVKAFEWFKKAAEQGCVPAQFNLSECFARGEGVEIDSEKAAEWYRKADEQNHKLVVDLQKKAPAIRFYNSIKNNNTEEVLKIINSGVNLNLSLDIPSEYTPLMVAAQLSYEPEINDATEYTPLMVAAQYDSKEVAELLIEHGAEVNLEPIVLDDGRQFFPLSAAAVWNSKNVAELLINHGAWLDAWDALDRDDYDIYEFLRPIDFAMINNSKDVVEVFLNHGYEFDSVNFYKEVEDGYYEDYEDPISYAEKHNFTEIAELLKKHFKKS